MNLAPLLPESVQQVASPQDKVMLVGDARAYLYPMPMTQLRYRTVFDVDNQDGSDIVWAWQGGNAPPAGWRVVVDPAELRRMQSYHGIVVPEDILKTGQPYVYEPAGVGQKKD